MKPGRNGWRNEGGDLRQPVRSKKVEATFRSSVQYCQVICVIFAVWNVTTYEPRSRCKLLKGS